MPEHSEFDDADGAPRGRPDHQALWRELENAFLPRRWDAVRTAWVSFIPTISPVGSSPLLTFSTFLEENELFSEGAPAKGSRTASTVARGEIPEIVFREGVYWLHKALHVLGASESHVDLGMPTWSLSSAYQCSYFAARCILAFLGVAVGEIERVSVVVDLCRGMQGLSPRKMQELGAFEEEAKLQSLGVLFDHRQIWMIFQRVLRTTTRFPWPEGWTTYFAQVDIGDITKQRHGLHYQLEYWVMGDLHQFVQVDEFRLVAPSGEGRELFSNDRNNFSLALAFTLAQMAVSLFRAQCEITNRLVAEQELIRSNLTNERHPVFGDALLSVG